MSGEINPSKSAVSKRIRFGFGLIQRDSWNLNSKMNGTAMPVVNVSQFSCMSTCLKEQAMLLFESATKFTSTKNKDAFPDKTSNHSCAGYLNQAMEFPKSASVFEYFDTHVYTALVIFLPFLSITSQSLNITPCKCQNSLSDFSL